MAMELTRVVMVMAMVVMSTMEALAAAAAAAAAAAPPFPIDCASYVVDGRAVPLKFCCIEVQDQFLVKKAPGIATYCNAVTAVVRYNGPLAGTELDLALGIPDKCGLDSYFKKGFRCAGKIIPGGVDNAL